MTYSITAAVTRKPAAEPPASMGDLVQLIYVEGVSKPNPYEGARKLGGAPYICVFSEGGGRVTLTRAWQRYIQQLNPNVLPRHMAAVFGNRKAFTNGTGFPVEEGDPPRQNWFENVDLNVPLQVELDKDRSCFLACHRIARETETRYILDCFDGSLPPPSIEDVNPATHPHFFFICLNLNYLGGDRFNVGLFPHGAPSWGVSRSVIWLPLVATHPLEVDKRMTRRVERWEFPVG